MYNLLKFLHVVSVVAWGGGVLTLLLLNSRLPKTDPAAARAVMMQGKFFSMTLFMPAAITVLITGLAMVMVNHLSFGLPWISAGFTLLILSIVVGGVLTGGTARKIAAGQGDPAVLGRKLILYARINMVIILAAIFVMVVKP